MQGDKTHGGAEQGFLEHLSAMHGSFAGQLADNRFADAWSKFMQALSEDSELLATLARRHNDEQRKLIESMGNGAAAPAAAKARRPDPRFAHASWQTNPFYRYLKESYELNATMLKEAAAAVELSAADRAAVDFMIDQLVSAMAPSNFPATNPEVIEATLASKGENLQRGMKNLMRDMETGTLTQTDPDAFAVGDNLATTPGKVVAQNHLMQLIEYAPTTAKVGAKPLLIVPPCINKYYILDLSPHNSFIRHLVDKGQRVFLVSWVNAGEAQAQLDWDDYIAAGVIEAIETVCRIAKQQKIHTLGYCIGGTLLGCALAVMRANKLDAAASMSLLTSFLDFVDTGTVGMFVDEKFVAAQERKFAAGGLFPGRDLQRTFAFLRPSELVWPYVVNNYMLGETPPAFDILAWNSDATNLPGRMYAWYLRHTYLDNDLKDGRVEVCGSKVRLDAIDLPGMVVATERDHIVPWQAAYASAQVVGGRPEFVLASSGHVAGVVNPPGKKKGYHMVAPKAGALPADAQTWLAKAKKHEGSWWDRYAAWLARRNGGKVAAPKAAGDFRHRPLEDAPGAYVTAPLPESW